jgi:hypothetical protein
MPYAVMTSTGGTRRGHGRYRNVAVVEYRDHLPKMISERARGMVRIVRHFGCHYVGTTPRCAYQRALDAAQHLCQRLTQEMPDAAP